MSLELFTRLRDLAADTKIVFIGPAPEPLWLPHETVLSFTRREPSDGECLICKVTKNRADKGEKHALNV